MDILLSALFFYLFLYCSYQVYRSFLAKKGTNVPAPPGPPPFPVIGNLLSLGPLPHRSLYQLSLTYGPIIKLSLGRITTVVVSSPALAREILLIHDSCFSNRFIPDAMTALDHYQHAIPFMPISPLFTTLRKIYSSHVFSARKLDDNRNLRVEQVQRLVEEVAACAKDGRTVNIGEVAFRTTFNLLSNTVFTANLVNYSSGSSNTGEMRELVTNIMAEVGRPNIADFFPVLKRWDPQGSRRRLETYLQRMFDIFDEMVGHRMDSRAEKGWHRKVDVLETLLDICQDKDEDKVDVALLKHLFLDFFVAGTDTTSNTLEWAMTELLRNTEKLSKAQSEFRDAIDRGNMMEESDIPRLPYLQAVVKETFRLHPPGPFLVPRTAREDKPVGGYVVPKGAQVLVNVWGMGRDEKVWGKTAGEFIPERFLESKIDVKGQHFELLPFGGGRRICPGMSLGIRMLHVILGTLIGNFNWEVAGEEINMDEIFGLTIQKAQPLKALPMAVVP